MCPVALRQLSRLPLESMLSHYYSFIVRTKTTCALHAQREHGDCYLLQNLLFCPFGKVVPVGGWYPTSYFPWYFAGRDAVIVSANWRLIPRPVSLGKLAQGF